MSLHHASRSVPLLVINDLVALCVGQLTVEEDDGEIEPEITATEG